MLRFKFHHLFALSLLVTGLCHHPAQAMGVHFELTEHNSISPTSYDEVKETSQPNQLELETSREHKESFQPLSIPPTASQPPINTHNLKATLPDSAIAATRVLTPPPTEALPTSRILLPNHSPLQIKPIALSFNTTQTDLSPHSPQPLAKPSAQSTLPDWIYAGGSDSLVARVIGSAEGTRTTSGKRTRAYYGHTDPGNGVWNMGTFSYQHGAKSPQEADKKQLKRLQAQGKTMANQANEAELTMTLGEMLNGLDLANQSPRAALEQGGYVDRLAQAKEKGMKNSDAIVWARTYSYLDPKTQRWNAPGLGNTFNGIQRDQNRRHDAIAQAFHQYQVQREDTDQPLKETLTAPAIALGNQPAQTIQSSNNALGAFPVAAAIAKQTPVIPLEFTVAKSLELTQQNSQGKTNSTASTPNSDAELSQAATTTLATENSSQANAHSEIEVTDPQAHS